MYEYVPDLRQIKDRLRDEFKDTSTLKKFVFLDYKRRLVLDVLDKIGRFNGGFSKKHLDGCVFRAVSDILIF